MLHLDRLSKLVLRERALTTAAWKREALIDERPWEANWCRITY